MSACNTLDLTPEPKSNEATEEVEYPAGAGAADPTTEPEPEPEPSETAGPLVKAVKATVGTIVTTAQGLPLYRWDKDAPATSTCYDACATTFTAQPYTDNLTVEGVDRKLVGKVQRKDGTFQLTINKWPVYTNVNDRAGTWTAHGQGGAWWLVTPDGKKVPAGKK